MAASNKESSSSIELGFQQARAITKRYAKTFYFASRFLSKEKRSAAYVIYSICRISDEAVDNAIGPGSLERLLGVKQKVEAAYAHAKLSESILLAFREIINKYNIPRKYFDQLIEGMYMDLEKNRYRNFAELYLYCHRAAGVVGLMMLKVFGCKTRQAEKYAVDLGVAMQLTNILRDIKEDFQRGRIYLPEEELARFAVTENNISQDRTNENFISLLKFQIKRARQYYASSTAGIRMIDDASSRFVVLAMKQIYSGILDAIERNGYDVFSQRAHVTTGRKIIIALKILLKGY